MSVATIKNEWSNLIWNSFRNTQSFVFFVIFTRLRMLILYMTTFVLGLLYNSFPFLFLWLNETPHKNVRKFPRMLSDFGLMFICLRYCSLFHLYSPSTFYPYCSNNFVCNLVIRLDGTCWCRKTVKGFKEGTYHTRCQSWPQVSIFPFELTAVFCFIYNFSHAHSWQSVHFSTPHSVGHHLAFCFRSWLAMQLDI